MTATALLDSPGPRADFRALDFERLWAGRGKVTRIESSILRCAFEHCDPSRVLEIGIGSGRLAETIGSFAREYVATDLTIPFLQRLPRPLRSRLSFCAAADVNRLPFADSAFSTVVMIRVYNFLSEPRTALAEIRRVLRPGGTLVFSHNPRPSIATLLDDLKVRLRPDVFGRPGRSATFSTEDCAPVQPSAFPAWNYRRQHVSRTLAQEGFSLVHEYATGFEDYRWVRGLPDRLFVSAASVAGGLDLLPTRFAVVRRLGVA